MTSKRRGVPRRRSSYPKLTALPTGASCSPVYDVFAKDMNEADAAPSGITYSK